MKRIQTIIALLLLTTCTAFAQSAEFNDQQLRLRRNISNWLRNEGFQPEIDSDGDIKFKREGTTYYVEVSKKDISPMYVSLSCYYRYNDDFPKWKIVDAMPSLSLWKAVKVAIYNENYAISYQTYLPTTDPEAFTSIFYKILGVMDGVADEIGEL